MVAKKVVFLDRDGTLNQLVARDGGQYSPQKPSDFVLMDGVKDVTTQLKGLGYELVVVTNQPDIARGKLTLQDLDCMHSRLAQEIPLLGIYVCIHDRNDGCNCRKPRPGLIRKAAEDFDINLSKSFMVGDRSSDVEAGRAAGVTTIQIVSELSQVCCDDIQPHFFCQNLFDVVRVIMQL